MGWVGAGSRLRRVVRRAGVASSLIDSRSGATFPAAGLAERRRRAGGPGAVETAAVDGGGVCLVSPCPGARAIMLPLRGRCVPAGGNKKAAA